MYREPTVMEKKPGLNALEHKEEINIEPEQNEETRIQKSGQNLGQGSSWKTAAGKVEAGGVGSPTFACR